MKCLKMRMPSAAVKGVTLRTCCRESISTAIIIQWSVLHTDLLLSYLHERGARVDAFSGIYMFRTQKMENKNVTLLKDIQPHITSTTSTDFPCHCNSETNSPEYDKYEQCLSRHWLMNCSSFPSSTWLLFTNNTEWLL